MMSRIVNHRLTIRHFQLHFSNCKSKLPNRGSAHLFSGVLQLNFRQFQSSVSEDLCPTSRQITTRLWPLHMRLYVTRCLATDGSIISLVDKEDFRGFQNYLDHFKLCLGLVRSDRVFRRAFVLAFVLFRDVKELQLSIFNWTARGDKLPPSLWSTRLSVNVTWSQLFISKLHYSKSFFPIVPWVHLSDRGMIITSSRARVVNRKGNACHQKGARVHWLLASLVFNKVCGTLVSVDDKLSDLSRTEYIRIYISAG